MSLQLFAHPFSSYCQKVLIALWADGTEFDYRMIDPEHPENMEELERHWPFRQFPLLLDDGRPIVETTCIIEHLQAPSGPTWIPMARGAGGSLPRPLFRPVLMNNISCRFNALGRRLARTLIAGTCYDAASPRYATAEANLAMTWAVGTSSPADCARPFPILRRLGRGDGRSA